MNTATTASSPAPVVQLSGVALRYGKTVALDGITLDIPAGRMVGLIGPCLLYTSPSPRDQRGSRMPSSA